MRYRLLMFIVLGSVLAAGPSHAQLLPGQVFPGLPPNPVSVLAEVAEPPAGTTEPYQQVRLQSPVQSGYLVLYEPGAANLSDPKNWSDVVIFASSQFPSCQPGDPANFALLVSDSPGEIGITNADLAQLGLTTAAILACPAFTVYQAEGTRADGLNVYAPDPGSVYNIFSDPEIPTPAGKVSWGNVKAIYR